MAEVELAAAAGADPDNIIAAVFVYPVLFDDFAAAFGGTARHVMMTRTVHSMTSYRAFFAVTQYIICT
jgi:hypothetical protein